MEEASSLDRALRLLFELAQAPTGLTVSELARRLEVQRPPLYRPLRTLMKHRMVRQGEGKLYHLGIGILELAEMTAGTVANEVRPILQAGADALSLSIMLVVAEGEEIVTLSSVRPSTPGLYLETRPGFVHPAGHTAPWLAIQASRSPQPDDSEAIRQTRSQGFAISQGHAIPGRTAIAAGVHLGVSKQVGAVLVVVDMNEEEGQLDKASEQALIMATSIQELYNH